MNWPMSFENYHEEKGNWSLKLGLNQFIYNTIVYLLIGISLDLLLNSFSFIKRFICVRKVTFDNCNMGIVEIKDLKDLENRKSKAVYNFTVERSQICCLIGNDSAQKSHLLEMLIGQRASKGSITIRDSDFFIRGKRPNFNNFIAYRQSNVVLYDELTALEHLNLFAHLRSNQKSRNVRILCENLLPEKTFVKNYSESQRQCLWTILALASENSKILVLDEPTRGLGHSQRSVLIKTLWSLKRDRYIIVQSSDPELVNVLADSVAKVMPDGVEMLSQREIDNEIGSYKLVVEVQDNKPCDNLVRYLSKDVPDLTLEYQTEYLTYYILPNISKQVLFKKTNFMENNKNMLGILDYELVSLPSFEVAQRNIPQIQLGASKSFEESVEDQDYAQSVPIRNEAAMVIEMRNNVVNRSDDMYQECDVNSSQNQQPQQNEEMFSKTSMKNNDENVGAESNNTSEIDGAKVHPTNLDEAQSQQLQWPESTKAKSENIIQNLDPEMKSFLEMMNEPLKKPAYRRDLFYDYKNLRSKPRVWPLQVSANCFRCCKQHWHNKLRFIALLILPALYVYASWHYVRYFYFVQDESAVLSTDWVPHKQPILVNEKTIIGNKDTKVWIDNLPESESTFAPTYIDTSDHTDYYDFYEAIYEYCKNDAIEKPWSLGSYQFYEMDEDIHRYKILTHVNATSPHSPGLYPQFIIESVLKTAFDDPDFEFKVRLTSMPAPWNITDKGDYLASEDLLRTRGIITMSDYVGAWQLNSQQVIGCIIFAWFMLNSYFLIDAIRDRTSQRKNFMASHGTSILAYWLIRYIHDLLWYIPITLVAQKMLETFEPHMEYGPRVVFWQPMAMLPFLYCCSFMFDKENIAALTLLLYQTIFQWLLPFIVASLRLNYKTEENGDNLFRLLKVLPLTSSSSSLFFNSKVLWGIHRFRENNLLGEGPEVKLNESDAMNGPADIQWIFIHTIFFWCLLLLVLEWKLPCICCSRIKRISRGEQAQFVKSFNEFDDDEEAGESSEVAQVCDDEQGIQVRFGVKHKIKKELAYRIKNLKLRRGGQVCGILCLNPQKTLISDLSAEVQVGTKFAIVSDGPQGKTTILNSLTNQKSAFEITGLLKKQAGRRAPVYTSEQTSVLFEDMTIMDNIWFYRLIGSVHPRLAKQMLVTFGLYERRHTIFKNLNVNEKHLTMLIMALAGSSKTCILDEPFTGLSHDQTIKLVKIIRQMYDCTFIVTAKSKEQLELLQPHEIMNLRDEPQEQQYPQGYCLSVRLKPQHCEADAGEEADPLSGDQQPVDLMHVASAASMLPNLVNDVNSVRGEQLKKFMILNVANFEKLQGKRRSVAVSAVQKIMRRAKMSQELCEEIAEMIYDDLKLQTTGEELALKCELMMSLYTLIEALCKRFGEVHLETRQDDYAVLRVVFNEEFRLKGLDDSFSDQNPVFSSVVEFVNQNDTVNDCTNSCHFIGARFKQSSVDTGSIKAQKVKVFRLSETSKRVQRVRPVSEVSSVGGKMAQEGFSEDSSKDVLPKQNDRKSRTNQSRRSGSQINKDYESRSHNGSQKKSRNSSQQRSHNEGSQMRSRNGSQSSRHYNIGSQMQNRNGLQLHSQEASSTKKRRGRNTTSAAGSTKEKNLTPSRLIDAKVTSGKVTPAKGRQDMDMAD